MQRIDVASASPTLPAPATLGTPGYFTDGDPVAGIAPTVVPADFLNLIMMELLNVIIAAGFAPSKTVMTQLRDAMPVYSSNANGTGKSMKFPSGAIFNWGNSATSDGTGKKTVTFATPFTDVATIGSWATNKASGPPTGFHGTGNESLTTMDVWSSSASGVASGAGTAFNYFAIGR